MTIREFFPIKLEKILCEKGMRQVDLANKTGLSQATISKYLSGTSLPGVPELILLANALEVSCDYLVGRNTEKK